MATKIEIPARDADRTRQAILDAAQQVFAEKGFAVAGVRDITARAGVNPSLVSRYFGGKLKLFEAALDVALDARRMTDLPRQELDRKRVVKGRSVSVRVYIGGGGVVKKNKDEKL